MPAAFYAISFGATGSVLALCSLEKQAPEDSAAWDKLRDTLVGSSLPVRRSGGARFEVPAALLAADAVSGSPPAEAITNPYQFRLGLTSTDPVQAGDGRDKVLKQAADNEFHSVTAANATKTLTVKLKFAAPPQAPAWLLYEDQSPIGGRVDPNDAKHVIFKLPLTVTIAAGDEFLLLIEGMPVTVEKVP